MGRSKLRTQNKTKPVLGPSPTGHGPKPISLDAPTRPVRRRLGVLLLWAGLLVPILAFGPVPLLVMIARAIGTIARSGSWPDARTAALLWRTVLLALSVAFCATFLGTVLGCRLGLAQWPGKNLARVLLVLPLVIPPYFQAVGWTTLLRAGGPVCRWLTQTMGLGRAFTADLIYSFGGAVAVLSLAYCPLALLLAEKSLAWSSPSLAEAALVFGAGRWQAFRMARWPFIRSAAASSAMIIFLLAAADLGVPTILKVSVFNFEVFTQLAAFNDITAAALLTVPLVLLGMFAVSAQRRLTGRNHVQFDVTDMAPPRRASTSQAITNLLIALGVAAVILGLPIGALLAEGADLQALKKMAPITVRPALSTLRYGLTAATLITAGACALAGIARTPSAWRDRLTDSVLVVGFAVPGTIVGLALLRVYDRPALAGWISPTALVIAALVVRYEIVAYCIIRPALAEIPDELLEAAAIDGAGPLVAARHIMVPMLRVALLATFALAFILAVGQIGSTILLYPPGGETLPIALYSIEANSPASYVAAMTIIDLIICAGPLVVIGSFVVASRADADLTPVGKKGA